MSQLPYAAVNTTNGPQSVASGQLQDAPEDRARFHAGDGSRNAVEARELSRRLAAVREQERNSIGRELHDQFGQMLTGLHLILGSIRAVPNDPEAMEARLGEAESIVHGMLDRMRAVALELRPPMLHESGLIPALSWHVTQYARQTGIAVDFRHGVAGQASADTAIAAFRIVQEALTNAARHANVTEVRVRVWTAGDHLRIEIADAGRGFDSAPRTGTLGIAGMRERAALLGGTAAVLSAPGEGTTVTVALPMGDPSER